MAFRIAAASGKLIICSTSAAVVAHYTLFAAAARCSVYKLARFPYNILYVFVILFGVKSKSKAYDVAIACDGDERVNTRET